MAFHSGMVAWDGINYKKMRYSKSKYPVGATWKGEKDGKIATITLREVSQYGYEIWIWNVMYDDGSGCKFDWATSYNRCKANMPFYSKMKRVI